jgi:phage I-like protein
MTLATATAIFGTDLAAASGTAPEWVELFPAGPELVAVDGRRWTANPAAVLAAFAARDGRPLPIDYEHAQAYKVGTGDEAPAAGWIVALEERAGAVWGKVEWTPRAARRIVHREYRYVSPEFQRDKAGQVLRLDGAALVNRPALEMLAALAARQPNPKGDDMKNIATALGLAEASEEKAIVDKAKELAAAATSVAAIATALKLDAGADQAAMLAAIGTLQEKAAADPGAATELAAVKTSLDQASARIAELETAGHKRDVDAALDEVQAAGKITPASREKYREMCADAGGLKRFRELAATLPVIAEPTRLGAKAGSVSTEEAELPAAELAAKARKYQSEQHALGNMVSITAAVAHVQEAAQ